MKPLGISLAVLLAIAAPAIAQKPAQKAQTETVWEATIAGISG